VERNGGMGGEGRAIGQSRLVELCLWKVGEREGNIRGREEGKGRGLFHWLKRVDALEVSPSFKGGWKTGSRWVNRLQTG